MRLLQYTESGELSIHRFDESAIPPYAILSHTWGADTDEVTFADLETGGGKTKPGYKKILFCGEQVRHDRLQHFWIDTCCINTTDKAEHSWAIRSMFRWYYSAAKCYVYLSDVSTRKRKACSTTTESSWEPAFRSSQWFKRGWTLQELLAPTIVEFFSQEGKMLGDKISLKSLIHKITSIPSEVLSGAPLSQSSVNERLRWAEGRITKRDEDRAYSLQGILDIELAPVYGEGAAGAFERLRGEIHKLERCIQDIRQADPCDDKKRIEDTKGGLLADSYQWILNNITFRQWQEDQHGRLLWVKGDPGKGKTMLLCGVINELQDSMPQTALLSYFFCQATNSHSNNATAVIRGLLYMLVNQRPSLALHARKRHDRAGRSLFEDVNAWVALTEIFEDVLQDGNLSATYLIIDALDECVADLPKLLSFIAKHSSTPRVKWIVSSRNWPVIEEQLERAEQKTRLSLELNAESVAAAVAVFIQRKVYQLAQEKQYKAETRHAVLQHLTSNANDTFLWVALVCQELKVTAKRNVLKKLVSFPPGLDALYQRMMNQISLSDDAGLCKQVLALIALVYRPVTLKELVALAEPLEDIGDETELREIVGLCGSFLTLRGDTVYFVHQSAKDFLFAEAFDDIFPNGTSSAHQAIFSKSLTTLSRTLHRDMYSLDLPGFPIDNVEQPEPDPLATSCYPCVYWIDHLYDSKPTLSVSSVDNSQITAIDEFLRNKYLYWLEGLSLCKSIEKGVISIAKLRSLVQVPNQNKLAQLVQDAQRFIMYHKKAIEGYPLQTYASALLFSPTGSLIRQLFQHEEPEGIIIKPAMSEGWSACLQTLEGHSDSVNSVAFSHDSTQLASVSYDKTVKIWDASSGACLQTLEGHSRSVNSVAFSHDSTQLLASASYDRTIKTWDVSSGACLQTLEGHSGSVNSVAFSHDSTQLLASASYDRTIKTWDVSSGACLQTLEGHSNSVNSVAFSHDSTQLLASASNDRTIKIWDVSSGACLQTLEGHSNSVNSVAFSHDSTQLLASASYDRTIKTWDVSSGACLQTLEGHSNSVNSVAFSHDSTQLLASVSNDRTIKIWDASSGACLQTLEGHSNSVNSVAFSHDSTQLLASVSNDRTMKIWDASSGACLQTHEGHSGWVKSVVFSHDSTQLASASYDRTVKIWDARSGACLQTLEGHSDWVSSVAFSYDSTQLASASYDRTIKIWDASSGAYLQTLEGHSGSVNSVAFSHDSTQLLASVSNDRTIKIWDARSGACLQTLEGHSGWVKSVAFSHDSTQLALASYDRTVKIWDASSGACRQTINVDKVLRSLSFNSAGSALYTEIGTIVIQSSEAASVGHIVPPERPLFLGISLSSDDIWIKNSNDNILWLPSEYRPSCSSVCGTMVGIGVGSGRVWSCRIDPKRL